MNVTHENHFDNPLGADLCPQQEIFQAMKAALAEAGVAWDDCRYFYISKERKRRDEDFAVWLSVSVRILHFYVYEKASPFSELTFSVTLISRDFLL